LVGPSEKSEVFIKYEAEVSSRVGGGERGVVDFGKLFTETNEQKFSLGEVWIDGLPEWFLRHLCMLPAFLNDVSPLFRAVYVVLVCLSVTSGYCVSGPGYIKLLAVGRQGTPKLKGHGQGHVTRSKILANCAP